jgi:hypothetical protein
MAAPPAEVDAPGAAQRGGWHWQSLLVGFALAALLLSSGPVSGNSAFRAAAAPRAGGGGAGAEAAATASPLGAFASPLGAAASPLAAAASPLGAAASALAPVFAADAWSFVGHVVYVNLPAAAERDAALRRDFLPSFAAPGGGGPPVTRFAAFEAPAGMPGIYGAALSHIGALQLALDGGFESVLVLEDDVAWRLSADGANMRLLQRLARQPYDVILLGATVVTHNATTSRVVYAHATSSYLVARHYLQTLIDNFAEGLAQLGREPQDHAFFIDVYWMRAMNAPGAKWFVVAPSLVVQESYLGEYVGFSSHDGVRSN